MPQCCGDIGLLHALHASLPVLVYMQMYWNVSMHGGTQVAAVDKPKVHLWETGITRITRHPQNTGQVIWCLGHLLWIGNSFMVTTSAALVAHHVFACYHGDFRLRRKHGEVSLLVLSVLHGVASVRRQ